VGRNKHISETSGGLPEYGEREISTYIDIGYACCNRPRFRLIIDRADAFENTWATHFLGGNGYFRLLPIVEQLEMPSIFNYFFKLYLFLDLRIVAPI